MSGSTTVTSVDWDLERLRSPSGNLSSHRIGVSLSVYGKTRIAFQLLTRYRPLRGESIEVGPFITLQVNSVTHVVNEGTSMLRANCVLEENLPGFDPLMQTGTELVEKTRKLLLVADNVRRLEVIGG